MDEISMEIEKLLDAVHRSDEYQEYQEQAAQLEADPELKARVMRFRGDSDCRIIQTRMSCSILRNSSIRSLQV